MKSFKAITGSIFTAVLILSGMALTSTDTSKKESDDDLVATAWNIDTSHSVIGFQVRHFFTPVDGRFTEYDATVNFDPDNLAESQVDFEIMVNSVDTGNERRDGHLQTADFFDAETYPTITFTSSEIARVEGNNYVARGELTIKDVTNEVELPFTLLGIQDHPMREGSQLAGIQVDYSLDRNEYGVGTGDWVSTAVVGGEVTFNVAFELNSTM